MSSLLRPLSIDKMSEYQSGDQKRLRITVKKYDLIGVPDKSTGSFPYTYYHIRKNSGFCSACFHLFSESEICKKQDSLAGLENEIKWRRVFHAPPTTPKSLQVHNEY